MIPEYVEVPPAPSPAFIPPDEETAKRIGLKHRSMKRESLVAFLQERREGKVDLTVLWALFLTRTVPPALDAYFDNLAVSLLGAM